VISLESDPEAIRKGLLVDPTVAEVAG